MKVDNVPVLEKIKISTGIEESRDLTNLMRLWELNKYCFSSEWDRRPLYDFDGIAVI